MFPSSVRALILALLTGSSPVLAQQPPLTETQELGRKLTSQACVVCHFPLQRGAHTYGPRLSRDSLSGDESALRTVIADGTPKMPGFKHMLDGEQIGAIVQYIKTIVPAPPPAAASAR